MTIPRTGVPRAIAFAALVTLAILAGVLAVVRTSIAGVYRVAGDSEAPTLLVGDIVCVDLAAYDLRWPLAGGGGLRLAEPRRGDLVLFDVPVRGYPGIKRVVGIPGDLVEVKNHRLIVNQVAAGYVDLPRPDYDWVPARDHLGAHVLLERSAGGSHTVSWDGPECTGASFGPMQVPAGTVFVLGDNRDQSFDSRSFGPLPRGAIRGRLIRVLVRSHSPNRS